MEQVFLKAPRLFQGALYDFPDSPAISHEICFRASGHALSTAACTDADKKSLWNAFSEIITQVKNGQFFSPIVYENDVPYPEYAALKLTSIQNPTAKTMRKFRRFWRRLLCGEKRHRIRQRSSDLRRIVSTALERNVKNTTSS